MRRNEGWFKPLLVTMIVLLAINYGVLRWAWIAFDIWTGGDMLASFLFILGVCGVVDSLVLFGVVFHKYCNSKAAAWGLTLLAFVVICGGWLGSYIAFYPAEFAESQGECIKVEKDTHTYDYDEASGTLTIGGRGPLPSGRRNEKLPWSGMKIRTLILEEGVTGIGYADFDGCTELEQVSLPDSLLYISMEAFRGCTALQEVVLPAHLKILRSNAFCGCTGLERVFIPAAVEEIQSLAFQKCYRVRFDTEENGIYEVRDGVLFEGKKNVLVCYPESKKDSGYVIADGVTLIDEDALYGASMQMLSVPADFEPDGSMRPDCEYLRIIFAPSGSKAAAWAEMWDYILIEDQEMPADSSAYEFVRGTFGAGDINADDWSTLYCGSFHREQPPEKALMMVWDYRKLLEELGEEELVLSRGISKNGFGLGEAVYHNKHLFDMDTEAWTAKCGTAPDRKVLPLISYEDKVQILPGVLARLPEEYIPTDPKQVEYYIQIQYESRKIGTYNNGTDAYRRYCLLKLLKASDGSLVNTRDICGGHPPLQTEFTWSDSYGSYPEAEEVAEGILSLLGEIPGE